MPRHHSSADKGIFIGFLILMFWLPLPLGGNRPWAWAIMEVWIFSLFLVWLWKFWQGSVKLTPVFYKAKPILILFGLWLFYIAFQCIPLPYFLVEWLSPEAASMQALGTERPAMATISVAAHTTAVSLLKSISYVLLFVLTLLLVRRGKRLRWLAYTLVLSGFFQAVYGSLMTLTGIGGVFFEKVHYIGLATGTFINRNHLAGYLEMCLAVGMGLLIAQLRDSDNTTWRQRLRSLVAWVLSDKMRLRLYLVMMVIALVLTRSRMGNTAFFASMMIAGVIGLILFRRYAPRATVMLLVSLIVIDILIVGAWFGVEKVAQRLQETSFAVEQRDEVNIYTIEYWQDYLWTGSGLGSYYLTFPRYRGDDVNVFYDHAHNDYLEFGAETGIIGVLLVGSIVVLSLGFALLAQYRRRDPLSRGMAFSAFMAIIALLIHSSVDFNLQIPANAATFMVILAMAWLAYFLKSETRGKSKVF
ncbi:MAG: O-antigen ligase family protein [Pseudomonadota bacterium]